MTESLRFVFAGRVVELGHFDPMTTVLAWLRTQGRRGAKEACAGGGCGACTVVVGELAGGRILYRAVNACATLLGRLDGRLLLTVEDLTDGDGAMHPAQQALAESAAAPCGFCAPGMIMSLFALSHNDPAPDDDDILAALAGNACRCVGRRGVLTAAQRLRAEWRGDRFTRAEAGLASLLESLGRQGTTVVRHAGIAANFPVQLEELEQILWRNPATVAVAGGAALAMAAAAGRPGPAEVAFIGGVAALRQVGGSAKGLEIGAAATLAEAVPIFDHYCPPLAALIRGVGAPQRLNGATLVGSLVSGAAVADLAPPLLALDATLLCNNGGQLREVGLAAYLAGDPATTLRPGEFFQALRVAPPARNCRFAVYRGGRAGKPAPVAAAFALTPGEAGQVAELRAAFSGLTPAPARLTALEAWSVGRVCGPGLADDGAAVVAGALDAAGDGAVDPYHRLLAVNLWRRFCAGPEGVTGESAA